MSKSIRNYVIRNQSKNSVVRRPQSKHMNARGILASTLVPSLSQPCEPINNKFFRVEVPKVDTKLQDEAIARIREEENKLMLKEKERLEKERELK